MGGFRRLLSRQGGDMPSKVGEYCDVYGNAEEPSRPDSLILLFLTGLLSAHMKGAKRPCRTVSCGVSLW
jgi:hypothetical protein